MPGAHRHSSGGSAMSFCTQCGAQVAGTTFCTRCGAQVRLQPAPPADDRVWPGVVSARPPARRGPGRVVATVALVAVLALAAGAAGTWWLVTGGQSDVAAPDAVPPPEDLPAPDPTEAAARADGVDGEPTATDGRATLTATPDPGPSADVDDRQSTTAEAPAVPSSIAPELPTSEEAVLLGEDQALARMDVLAASDLKAVDGFAGSWVPQVSSKCGGLDVDLGPGWTPDGVVDTTGVLEAEIFAFHLAMASRYGAVLTTATALGVDTMPAACAGRPLWVSLVPEPYADAPSALAWCDRSGLPVDECGARLVMPLGQTGTRLELREG